MPPIPPGLVVSCYRPPIAVDRTPVIDEPIPTRASIHGPAQPLQDLARALGFADVRLVRSVARGNAPTASDVDCLVVVGPRLCGAQHLGAMDALRVGAELLVGPSVDVIDLDAVTDAAVRADALGEAHPP